MNKNFKIMAMVVGLSVSFAAIGLANNLTISNVSMGTRDPNAKTIVVSFNASWNNSWRNKINHDAIWLTVRLNNTQTSPTAKQLCAISASGLNPAGTSTGNVNNLEMFVPTDRLGAFLRRSTSSTTANITAQNLQLTINYQSCGFSDSDQIYASIFGLEMVYIPQGSFYAGDYNTSTASLNKGNADSSPWSVLSEGLISVADPASGGYRYVSNGNSGEYPTAATFTLPASFPKGYAPFYVMKYEINEGQWVEFLNSLPSAAARANHDITDTNHKNSDSVIARNTISCSGSPLVCTTQRPARAVNFLNWMDLAAFLDWDGLRPMTELEFEKMSRGPALPVAGEYIWGSTTATPADAISGSEDGTETITTAAANANYNNTSLSGGDAAQGGEYVKGALRNGIFAGSSSNRIMSGASYYGVLDLGGNLKERTVTIGNASGLGFKGTEGDGVLSTTAGFQGYATNTDWPGIDPSPDHGITGANGSGFRGGSFADSVNFLRTSDRSEAALTSTAASSTFGGRGVRSYDGN